MFDEVYYYQNYPDVRQGDLDTLWHFVKYRWKEGGNLSEAFFTSLFPKKYIGIQKSGINPLVRISTILYHLPCHHPLYVSSSIYMRNFGHKGEEDYFRVGINGKLSELHAAIGLSILPYVNKINDLRKQICDHYDKLLQNLNLERPALPENKLYNYAYYPVLFPSEESFLAARGALNEKGIYPRRYFYPSLNTLPYIDGPIMKWSEDLTKRVLCLPLYADLKINEVNKIADILQDHLLLS